MIVLGASFSLLSAFSFATNAMLVRRGMAGASASQGTFITVLIGVPLFIIASLLSGQVFHLGDLPLTGYLLLSGAGIIHFVLGRYCNYRAIGAIGASRSQPIQAVATPYSILIAFLWLGETINWWMALGIVLIMVGPTIFLEKPTRASATPPRGGQDVETRVAQTFQLRQLEGYTFALLAAACYGTSPLLIRAALEAQTDLSIFGGMIAYVAAAAVLLASLAIPGRRELMGAINLRTFRLFFGAGAAVFFAQLFRFIALSLAPIAIVTPLQRLVGLFTLLLSATVNRGLEKVTWRVVLGVFVSLGGTLLLVLSSDL